jgi:hypothetical protein
MELCNPISDPIFANKQKVVFFYHILKINRLKQNKRAGWVKKILRNQ